MMKRTYFLSLLLVFNAAGADKLPASKLLEMAAQDADNAAFRQGLLDAAGAEAVQKGTAFVGEGSDFLFAVDAASKPQIIIDDKPGPAMSQLKGSNTWIARAK